MNNFKTIKKNNKRLLISIILLVIAYYIFYSFKDNLKFWFNKGVPEDYIRIGNIWIDDVDTKIYGIDLDKNLLTIKGKKPSNWYIKAFTKWQSSGDKCLVRKDWTGNPTMIPRRYQSTYYGIDQGDSFIITIPQQTKEAINKCNDHISKISVNFYRKGNGGGGGTTIQYFPRTIPLSKKNRGYPASPRKHDCKEEKSSSFTTDYLLRCKRNLPESHDGYQVYHDEIKPYTIVLDFYVDDSWF